MKRRSPRGCGSFLFFLLFIFVILKVAGAVDWSWWWVISPIWLPLAVALTVLTVMALMGVGVYKVVAAVLRRQDFAGTKRRTDDPSSDVLEAEGTEVPISAKRERDVRGLPVLSSTSSQVDGAMDIHSPEQGDQA